MRSFVLDGDNIRHGLCAPEALLVEEYGSELATRFGLGFAELDRQENIRRVGAVAGLFYAAGVITLAAFVSPYRRDRDAVRRHFEQIGQVGNFIEVFVDAPLEVCESRDPKGIYKKARAGIIKNFTGISDPYEPPLNPELTLDAAGQKPDVLAQQIISHLVSIGKIAKDG